MTAPSSPGSASSGWPPRPASRSVVVDGDHFFLHEDTARGVALIEEHLG